MIDKRKQIIEVIPYDVNWQHQFIEEAKQIEAIFSHNFVTIHHIGSTSISNMPAKPTIDILLVVNSIEQVDDNNQQMAELGYDAWGEYHISGRRFFVKGKNKRTHHVHTFEVDSTEIDRHLHFRDYLIAHPDEAKGYADLKLELAKKFAHDRRAYVVNKKTRVEALEEKAIIWANTEITTYPTDYTDKL
jgi:GrpB-like predicted nucleotidyltransferase (UPF0157 family)